MRSTESTEDAWETAEGHRPGLISLPKHVYQVAEMCAKQPVFSERFVWGRDFKSHRFEPIIGGTRRITTLEAVVHSRLSPQTRAAIFPTKYHPGSGESLSPSDCTYQAIADAVASSCNYVPGSISGEFIKDTANSLVRLTGFSVTEHRNADPVRFARTVWLFAYLKKTRGPGIVGMLRAPDTETKPSLEVTSPYLEGFAPGTETRMDFHDVQVYLSLQLPLEMLARIEKCLPSLMPAMVEFIASVETEAYIASYAHQDARIQFLQSAAHYYNQKLGELLEQSRPTCRPLDEALYIHAKTLEVRHYAGFKTVLSSLEFQRPDLPRLDVVGIREARAQWLDEIDYGNTVESFRNIAEAFFDRPVNNAQVKNATQLARHVLKHYLWITEGVPFAIRLPIPFVKMFAAVMYALQLGNDPAAHNHIPHIFGLGQAPKSIVTAIEGEVNERHEEFEHIIVDAVDWYRAALLNSLPLQRAILEMRDVIEQGVGRLCEVNDLDVMEKALAMMVRAPTAKEWGGLKDLGTLHAPCSVELGASAFFSHPSLTGLSGRCSFKMPVHSQ